jgi:polyisoprenoid-binding protein YceI
MVTGVLDFHGKRRPLSFPATVAVGETAITVSATFDINRQNWGVAYPGKPDDLIKDDVRIHLDLTFPTSSIPKAE